MTGPFEKLSELLSEHRQGLIELSHELGTDAKHVDERLATLHAQLLDAVQQQRGEAQREVQLVRAKVHAVSKDIHAMHAALGALEGESEAEFPNEPLLAALDRLQQVHADLTIAHTARVAQFNHVRQELQSALSILGADFPEAATLLGPANSVEEKPPQDLKIATLALLERGLAKCRHELDKREEVLEQHLGEILALWSEMGINPSACQESSAEADYNRLMLAHLTPDDPTRLLPTSENLSRASSTRMMLEEEKERRESLIQEIYDDLANLWTKLGVSEGDQDVFLELWKGIEQRCIDAYQTERQRMVSLKLANMALFIERERADIKRLWDETYESQEQQGRWQDEQRHLEDDDLLEAFECERKRLEGELQRKAPVLVPLRRYLALLQEIQCLAESAKDQSRFKTKGDPGRLLREEKQRKRHVKEKPRLEADLLAAIPKWEEENGEPFMVNGKRYLDELTELATQKKSSIPPRSKTPTSEVARIWTPGPGEPAKIFDALQSKNSTRSAVIAHGSLAMKRSGIPSVAATPTAAKRPRIGMTAEIRPFGTKTANSAVGSSTKHSVKLEGSIAQLDYPGSTARVSRDWKPRPSLTSLASTALKEGLITRAPTSTVATVEEDSDDAK